MTDIATTMDTLPEPGNTPESQASQRRLIASDRVTGTAVRRANGEKIGTIERLMIDKVTGKVDYAVMTFGGFLGIGEGYYPLPWHLLRYNTSLDAYELDVADDQLRGGPRDADSEAFNWSDADFTQSVGTHYETPPTYVR